MHELQDYLEEQHHVLFGLGTPIFVAKLNSTGKNDTKPSVIYERAYYVRKNSSFSFLFYFFTEHTC